MVDGTFTSNIHLYPSVYYPLSNFHTFWRSKSEHEQPQPRPHNPSSSSIHSTCEADEKFEIGPVNGCSIPTFSTLCSGIASNLGNKECGSICNRSGANDMPTPAIATATLSESVNDSNVLIREPSSHHGSEREAALIEFRLKRKARCNEKKVRYQNRKRLAEKRP